MKKITELIHMEGEPIIFTVDINSLYTNISRDLELKAVYKAYKTNQGPSRPDEVILQLLHISLTSNDSQFYLQVQGTAMGKKFAPAYANLYMVEW